MGGKTSKYNWQPSPEPAGTCGDSPVDYHLVASPVTLGHTTKCSCIPKVSVNMDSDDLYAILGAQYGRGYRMLHFMRVPGDMQVQTFSLTIQIIFLGFFRMNPNMGGLNGAESSWQLRVERSWVQTLIHDKGLVSIKLSRVVHTSNLVESITRNTQNGERLVAATVTGHSESQTTSELLSGYGPHDAVDLFFEVPCPVPWERYVYNIALVPVHVEFNLAGCVFFPEIICDWLATLNFHLNQGWRLIDVYIDIPIIEQLRTPRKQLNRLCRPTDTNALWIFEKPASSSQDPTPRYEGTIVEQIVPVKGAKHDYGVQSSHDWLPVIRDMGSRGWELACMLECHSVESTGWGKATLKSLLFFQRPLG